MGVVARASVVQRSPDHGFSAWASEIRGACARTRRHSARLALAPKLPSCASMKLTRLVVTLAALALVACGRPPLDTPEGSTFMTKGSGSSSTSGGFSTATPSAGGDATGASVTRGNGTVAPGVLTAGAWDDNDNFDRFVAFRDTVPAQGKPPYTDAEQRAANQSVAAARTAKTALDIVLVIDTTGSMGDEISYLQQEFTNISQLITDRYPNVRQRWGFVAYKDYHDVYVVKGADFGTSVTWFQGQLGQLEASGGDDYPEVPDQGLAQAARLTWDPSADTARLVFWVADAPHHDDKAADMADAVRALRSVGAHIYPVASSGVDTLTEYTMRAAAQLTLGRYVFLTDDSGVGDSHETPAVPCFIVTHLNQAMVRAVDIELSGAWHAPEASEVVRTVGAPSPAAVCSLADGTTATAF